MVCRRAGGRVEVELDPVRTGKERLGTQSWSVGGHRAGCATVLHEIMNDAIVL